MYGLVLALHILVCVVLIGIVLLQGGRGGLSDALGGAAAQSLFGGGATTILTRLTAICAGLFVVTCLTLAYLSTVRGRSVIESVPMVAPESLPLAPLLAPEDLSVPSAQPTEQAGQPGEAPRQPDPSAQ